MLRAPPFRAAGCHAAVGCALLAASALAGCGPSLRTLLQQRRAIDALCRVEDEADARLVLPVLLDQLAARWRVRPIVRQDLAGLDATLADQIFGQAQLFIVDVKVDQPPHARVSELHGIREGYAFRLLSPSDFAALTGEATPQARKERVTRFNAAWAFITLGLSVLFDGRTEQVTRYPTDADRRRAAPRSAQLYDAIVRRYGFAHVIAVRGTGRLETQAAVDLIVSPDVPDCRAQPRIRLRSEPIALGSSRSTPADGSFRRFPTASWRGSFGAAEWGGAAPPRAHR